MREYKSKFLQLLFLLKKRLPEHDLSFSCTKAGDYIILIEKHRMMVTPDLIEDMSLETLADYIIYEMNNQW